MEIKVKNRSVAVAGGVLDYHKTEYLVKLVKALVKKNVKMEDIHILHFLTRTRTWEHIRGECASTIYPTLNVAIKKYIMKI